MNVPRAEKKSNTDQGTHVSSSLLHAFQLARHFYLWPAVMVTLSVVSYFFVERDNLRTKVTNLTEDAARLEAHDQKEIHFLQMQLEVARNTPCNSVHDLQVGMAEQRALLIAILKAR